MFFKNKKKNNTKSTINIENVDDIVNFSVSWNNSSVEQINFLIKLLVMLKYGALSDYINTAIIKYGKDTGDISTAEYIIQSMNNLDNSIGYEIIQEKYLNKLLSTNKRNPSISPDEVLNVFKNSIG